jgi:hypothetical protein
MKGELVVLGPDGSTEKHAESETAAAPLNTLTALTERGG